MISICMTYKNRKRQLIQTLYSIKNTSHNDFEVIIVDDASDSDHRIEDILPEFPFVRLIRIEPKDKRWKNPCIPYNMAFREAKGDTIIIQNPECAHCGDVIDYVDKNQQDNMYLNFACLSLPHILTEKYCDTNYFAQKDMSELENIASGMGQPATFDGDFGWYNHPTYLPRGLHFCNSIKASDLNRIGGFDERFSGGLNFDDNELVWRINMNKINMAFTTSPFVVHQFHYTDCSTDMDPNKNELVQKNAQIFDLIQRGIMPVWNKPLK